MRPILSDCYLVRGMYAPKLPPINSRMTLHLRTSALGWVQFTESRQGEKTTLVIRDEYWYYTRDSKCNRTT